MTLMEAIEHCEEKARELGCTECAAEHWQLASWLRRLAAFEADAKFIDGLTLAKKLKAAQCQLRDLKRKRIEEKGMHITIHPLRPDFIQPMYQTAGAAAFDLYLQEDLYLTPDEPVKVGLGFAADIEDGYSVMIIPRSSAGNMGVRLCNTVGLIDSDYRNKEWFAKLASSKPLQFRRGDRILQAIVTWSFRADGIEVADKVRGESGSTGR